MIEQPLDYDDLRDHATLQRRLSTPICLDESIHSVRAAEDAIALGACRIINIKPGRVGGHGPSIQLHDLAARHGVPVWHGGMLESGIGRAHNIHLSTLPNFTLPGGRGRKPAILCPRPDRSRDRRGAGWHDRRADGAWNRRPGRCRSCGGRDSRKAGARTLTMVTTFRFRSAHARLVVLALATVGSLRASGCATPPAPAVTAPAIRYEQKLAWILELEDQRILRAPSPPPAPPPAPVQTGKKVKLPPPPPPPPPPPDLTVLVKDSEPRIRRRAALAIGRVGLPDGIATAVGDACRPRPGRARDGRVRAGPDRRRIGGRRADARSSLTRRRSCAGARRKRWAWWAQPERRRRSESSPASTRGRAPVAGDEAGRRDHGQPRRRREAFELALFALVRLKAYEPLASAVLEADRPVTHVVARGVRAAAHRGSARGTGAVAAPGGRRAATRRRSRRAGWAF